jgi:Trp operon repressor
MALSTVQIKKALKDRKLTHAKVAESVGLNVATITKNVNKVPGCKSSRARQAIASAIEMTVEEVFGAAA